MNRTAISEDPQIAASAGAVQLLRTLIQENTGIFFDDTRLGTLMDKLGPWMARRGFRSVLDYYYALKQRPHYSEEWRRVLDALCVPETYFWREMDQVRAFVDVVVPQWFSRTRAPLRVWVAACSTGEEAYSIAMALEEAGHTKFPILIVASDASEAVLEKARTGVYRERAFRALPPALREKYFRPMPNHWLLKPNIASRVRFERVNLTARAETRELAQSPVIFCRNVFIYFSPETIRQVVRHFAERMPSGGHLFVGTSESLLKLTGDFELTEIGGAFAYVRKPQLSAPPIL